MSAPPVVFGLTALGAFHTGIGIAALAAGVGAYAVDREIRIDTALGRLYVALTFVTAATALGIFQHGGFGPPHALALLTLAALASGLAASAGVLGRVSRYVAAVCFASTFLFHLIPAATESLTRLPLGAPLVASQDAPIFLPIYGALVVLFLVGCGFHLRALRAG